MNLPFQGFQGFFFLKHQEAFNKSAWPIVNTDFPQKQRSEPNKLDKRDVPGPKLQNKSVSLTLRGSLGGEEFCIFLLANRL